MTSSKPTAQASWRGRSGRLAAAGLLLAAATLALTGSTSAPAAQSPGLPSESRPGHVVLVELFTSQGCSSCPPADRLLATLGEEGGLVVPLSFHVDFWNSGGWTDPFSTKEWTQRQVAYARALGLSQVYTPQAVVDGGTEMVGSDADRLRAAIAAAAARPAAEIALHVDPPGSRVKVGVDVTLPEALRGESLDLVAVVFERGLVTPVGRGENGGKTLRNDYVVRTLERVDRLAANGPPKTHHAASLRLSKDWDATRLGVAAFLQDPKSLAIRGAAATALATRTEN